ncbi:MAG: MTH1187 family thiamine-binding protein, partial [Candidatus Berkiellales bacterium]
RILKKANLKVQLHAEGTNIEGDLNEVMEAIKRCLETLHDMEVPRLITNVKLSTRIDKSQTMEDKIKSVEQRL